MITGLIDGVWNRVALFRSFVQRCDATRWTSDWSPDQLTNGNCAHGKTKKHLQVKRVGQGACRRVQEGETEPGAGSDLLQVWETRCQCQDATGRHENAAVILHHQQSCDLLIPGPCLD